VHNKKLQQPMEMVLPEELKGVEYTVYEVTSKMLEIFENLKVKFISVTII